MELKITYLETAGLVPYANNARTHSEAQVAQIAASIKEFGFTNPVLIDENKGIIAGHGRVMAAELLGMGTVPCITLESLSAKQKRAYVIADNKIALGSSWDAELLAIEFKELEADGFDLALTGFDIADLDKVMVSVEVAKSSAKEIYVDDILLDHKCPKCGFEFDGK